MRGLRNSLLFILLFLPALCGIDFRRNKMNVKAVFALAGFRRLGAQLGCEGNGYVRVGQTTCAGRVHLVNVMGECGAPISKIPPEGQVLPQLDLIPGVWSHDRCDHITSTYMQDSL
ncbi:hypothetical protein BGX38DRAFT_156129 [Terfezia claveryi]|nr:hypothetical protein BGX38DRAFT_156129 [Terfezia claveryi]